MAAVAGNLWLSEYAQRDTPPRINAGKVTIPGVSVIDQVTRLGLEPRMTESKSVVLPITPPGNATT